MEALSTGDWSLVSANESFAPRFEEAWQEWADLIDEVVYREAFERLGDESLAKSLRSGLLDRWAGLLFKLDADGVFHKLNRLEPFTLLAVDHDENIVDVVARMKRIRQQGIPAQR